MSDTHTLDEQSDAYQVTVEFLSPEAQQIVHDGLAAGEDNPDDILLHAQDANAKELDIAETRHEQADAVADGNFAKADDLAANAEYDMHVVAADGATDNYGEIVQAQHDEFNLSTANSEQETAADYAHTADSYAAAGDVDHAVQYGEVAADHADTAAVAADAGDAGGHYASHDGTEATESVEATSE